MGEHGRSSKDVIVVQSARYLDKPTTRTIGTKLRSTTRERDGCDWDRASWVNAKCVELTHAQLHACEDKSMEERSITDTSRDTLAGQRQDAVLKQRGKRKAFVPKRFMLENSFPLHVSSATTSSENNILNLGDSTFVGTANRIENHTKVTSVYTSDNGSKLQGNQTSSELCQNYPAFYRYLEEIHCKKAMGQSRSQRSQSGCAKAVKQQQPFGRPRQVKPKTWQTSSKTVVKWDHIYAKNTCDITYWHKSRRKCKGRLPGYHLTSTSSVSDKQRQRLLPKSTSQSLNRCNSTMSQQSRQSQLPFDEIHRSWNTTINSQV